MGPIPVSNLRIFAWSTQLTTTGRGRWAERLGATCDSGEAMNLDEVRFWEKEAGFAFGVFVGIRGVDGVSLL